MVDDRTRHPSLQAVGHRRAIDVGENVVRVVYVAIKHLQLLQRWERRILMLAEVQVVVVVRWDFPDVPVSPIILVNHAVKP